MPKVQVHYTRKQQAEATPSANGHTSRSIFTAAQRAVFRVAYEQIRGRLPSVPKGFHEDRPTPTPDDDIIADAKALIQVVSFLRHETPEREALLKAAGLPSDAISARLVDGLSEFSHCWLDEWRREAGHVASWRRLSFQSRDEMPQLAGLNTRRLSEVLERELPWLWWQRVPLGKLTLISGDPDLGKTWLILDILARITNGTPLPDGSPNPFAGKKQQVLWVSAEDDDEDTIKPRFRMLRGDQDYFHSLQFVLHREQVGKNEHESQEQILNLQKHLDALDQWLLGHPLVVAIGLDPLAAFLGKIDTHRNSDVRSLLTPLTQLASKRRVAILGANHLNKGEGENALYRGMGSIAFVAAARSSWLVTRDPKKRCQNEQY